MRANDIIEKRWNRFFLIILTCFRYKTVSLMKDWRKRHALPVFYWQQIIWHHEQFGPLQGQDMLRSNAGSSRITKNGSSHECHMIGGAWSAELSHLSWSCQPCSPCLMLSWLCGIEFRNVYQSATDPQILEGGLCLVLFHLHLRSRGVYCGAERPGGNNYGGRYMMDRWVYDMLWCNTGPTPLSWIHLKKDQNSKENRRWGVLANT